MPQEKNMFSSEVELSKFVGSIDLIQDAYRAILQTSSPYGFHQSSSGIQVLAFHCPPEYGTRFLKGEFRLVSSENQEAIDVISTAVGSSFFINKAAVDLFKSVYVELKEIQNTRPLVITGQSLGGYLAILFTIWQQHAKDIEESTGLGNTKTRRPICITFGSPLVGDQSLQRAVSERPKWKSCFLNVVGERDEVASFFSSNTPYKPIGAFLFCTEKGGKAVFEDQEAILAILDNMASSKIVNLEAFDYGNVLSSIRRKVLYRGVSELGEFNHNSLRAGIFLQFMEVGLADSTKDSLNTLIEKMEKKQEKLINKMRNVYDPTRKLNKAKISMVCMERYMKTRKPTVGYYDSYKTAITDNTAGSREEIKILHEVKTNVMILYNYWDKFVEEKQTEGPKLRSRWLYGGTNYRRIIEPLMIADYYKNSGKNYIEHRSNHYKLLEKWMAEDQKNLTPTPRMKAASLTEDSCFWAHVEEALISLRDLKNGDSSKTAALEAFEAYVMRAIHEWWVSSDVFLEESSLMKWWNGYKECKGSSYASEFAQYMNDKSYESYK